MHEVEPQQILLRVQGVSLGQFMIEDQMIHHLILLEEDFQAKLTPVGREVREQYMAK